MTYQSETEAKLRDPVASRTFQELVGDLREALLSEAAWISTGDEIMRDDLVAAYEKLRFPNKDSLRFADAQSVVSQALRENRVIEWVSYTMAIVLFIFGLVLLAIGAAVSDAATRISCLSAGSIIELLILVPFRFAINSRRHNIALRISDQVTRVHNRS